MPFKSVTQLSKFSTSLKENQFKKKFLFLLDLCNKENLNKEECIIVDSQNQAYVKRESEKILHFSKTKIKTFGSKHFSYPSQIKGQQFQVLFSLD